MKKTTLLLTTLLVGGLAQAQSARVQVIHNSADLAAATVDVYLNSTLLLDDLDFRTASEFIDAPAGVMFTVGIAPATSTSAADAIYTQDFTLADGETYIVVASGIVSGSGYMPAAPFELVVYPLGREMAVGGAMMTDILVHHGSTDAPTVDVYESANLSATVVDDAMYGDFAGYLEVPTIDLTLQVRDQNNSTIIAAYDAPLATLGLGGSALVALASGFLDPSMNSGGPAFGIWVALPAGGPLVQLPASAIPTARVQVIHNSADLAAATVDVWLNETLLLNDFEFRTASPFVDAQAGVPFDVSVALPTSTDTVGALARFTYTLDEDGSYILVANGIVSGSGYTPVQPFDIYVAGNARETSMVAGNVDVLVFHGSTDAPTVDVVETSIPAGILVDDASYGDFAGYLELPAADYALSVESMGVPVASYQAPLATLGLAGNAITVLASGFLDPSMNSGGPSFGLWAALPTGGPLVALPLATGITENGIELGISLYPNPAREGVWLQFDMPIEGRSTINVIDALGRTVMTRDQGTNDLGAQRVFVELNGLEDGAYWLRFQRGTGEVTIPFIKG